MERLDEETYMRLALDMAKKTRGQTGINPVVGCVIVREGRIVGMGAHLRRGSHHAEIHALNMAGEEAKGSTVYVTLEPCSHYGKTPPCADRLIAAGVQKVVVAAEDPNPRVAGNGIRKLREGGIEVETGLLREEAEKLNEMFNKYIVTGLPFVTLKTASTLDGKIASRTGDSRWVTGEAAREYVHVLRHRHQAIMVGVETVLRDDPRLTARLSVNAVQPVRIVADSQLRIPENATILQDGKAPTWILTTRLAPAEKVRRLESAGAVVIPCGGGPKVELREAMKRLGEREIGSILVEGGGVLNGALLEAGLADKIVLFLAPKIIGGRTAPASFRMEGFARMAEAIRLNGMEVQSFGEDVCITGYPEYGGDADVYRNH